MHVERVVHPVEMLVVMANGVDLRLCVAQFVNRLHLASDLRPLTTKLPCQTCKAAMRLVFQRRNTLDKQFQRIDVTRIRQIQMRIVLRKAVHHRVQLFVFFRLVFPVSIHGQAKRVFPFAPIGDFDAFVGFIGKHFVTRLVSRFPAQTTGE